MELGEMIEGEKMVVGEMVEDEGEDSVRLATIYKGRGKKMARNLQRLVFSLMESSEKVRIVLLVLTDTESQPDTEAAIANTLGKFYTEGIVHGYRDNGVSLHVEFVDLDNLTSTIDRQLLDGMKGLFGPRGKSMVLESSDPRRQVYFPHLQDDVAVSLPTLDKYDLDLFFLAPFYPSFFPNLRKLIVVDLDVEFRVGVEELAQQFSLLDEEQLMALARDQSPYYPFITGAQDKPRKGLNSGVALYHLERMRSSLVYREELTRERMAQLSDKYLPSPDWSLGDQDWLTLLSWEHPSLVASLPCRYNSMQCHTAAFGDDAMLAKANLPCEEKVAIAHYCGIETTPEEELQKHSEV